MSKDSRCPFVGGSTENMFYCGCVSGVGVDCSSPRLQSVAVQDSCVVPVCAHMHAASVSGFVKCRRALVFMYMWMTEWMQL